MHPAKLTLIDQFGNEIEWDDCKMVPDGYRLRVPMALYDHALPATLTDARVTAAKRVAERVAHWADHYATQRRQRDKATDADPSASAYRDLCANLQRGCVAGAA